MQPIRTKVRTNHRPTVIQKGGYRSTPIKETTAPIKTQTKQNKTILQATRHINKITQLKHHKQRQKGRSFKTLTDKSTNTTQRTTKTTPMKAIPVPREIDTNTSQKTTAVATHEGDHRASEKHLDTLISKLRRKNNNVPSGQTADTTTRQPGIGEIGRQTMTPLNTDHTP